jgi:hypothetical protein
MVFGGLNSIAGLGIGIEACANRIRIPTSCISVRYLSIPEPNWVPYTGTGLVPSLAFLFIPAPDCLDTRQSGIYLKKFQVEYGMPEKVSPASAFLPAANFLSPNSAFRHLGQSGTAGHGLFRHCAAILNSRDTMDGCLKSCQQKCRTQ